MIKHKPPIGVIGPNILEKEEMPNNSEVASKYKDPEKNKMPAVKNQPAKFSDFVSSLVAKNTTANKPIT